MIEYFRYANLEPVPSHSETIIPSLSICRRVRYTFSWRSASKPRSAILRAGSRSYRLRSCKSRRRKGTSQEAECTSNKPSFNCHLPPAMLFVSHRKPILPRVSRLPHTEQALVRHHLPDSLSIPSHRGHGTLCPCPKGCFPSARTAKWVGVCIRFAYKGVETNVPCGLHASTLRVLTRSTPRKHESVAARL